jgi:hypothetical protein
MGTFRCGWFFCSRWYKVLVGVRNGKPVVKLVPVGKLGAEQYPNEYANWGFALTPTDGPSE